MDSDELLLDAEEKMEGAIASFKHSLAQARTGKASPKMFEGLTISYYGVDTLVSQIAGFSTPEGNQIYIKPYDKSTLNLIQKAILAGNYGVTPQNDGNGIRIILPAMTEENRRSTCKEVSKSAEQAKVVIRNIRQEANNGLKANEKNKEISEDMLNDYLKDVQDLTDKYTKLVDSLLDDKVKEIMTI